jgi:hypothetical protein
MIAETAPSFMPSVTLTMDVCPDLSEFDFDEKVNGVMIFEVMRVDEYGIELKIKSATLNKPKRVE